MDWMNVWADNLKKLTTSYLEAMRDLFREAALTMGEDMPAPRARRCEHPRIPEVGDAVPGHHHPHPPPHHHHHHHHRTMTFRSVARSVVVCRRASNDRRSSALSGPEGQARCKARVMTATSSSPSAEEEDDDASRANTSVSSGTSEASPLAHNHPKPLDLMNALKSVTRSGDNTGAGRGRADSVVDPALAPFEKMKKMRLPEGIR